MSTFINRNGIMIQSQGRFSMLYDLRDDQWEVIKDILPGKSGDRGRSGFDNRGFIRAVMLVAKTGAPWRALPQEYGNWPTVHKRFMRWAKAGVWQMIFNTLAINADNEWIMIDSTIIRAHQHSAGALKKYRNWYARTRSRKVQGGI